jgi:hypothetical protein
MSFEANVLRVMIASPGDVAEERRVVTEEIHRWNDANAFARRLVLLPVKWETHSTPQMGDDPQTIIDRQLLEEADIVVGIFGTRIGTPTEKYVSGTVEEIKKHVAAGKTAKIYFSDVPVAPSSLDPTQYASLKQFREECQSTGLYATFSSVQQFRTDFSHHLDLELNQLRYRWLQVQVQPTYQSTTDLDPDALRLIKAAASSDDGMVISQETMGGDGLRAGGEEFVDGTTRSAAKWRGIVGDLVRRGILENLSKGVYRLSAVGYEITDKAQALEEASQPTEITVSISGPPDGQYLNITSSRILNLSQLDFLTSAEACVSTQILSDMGTKIEAKLAHDKVVTLYNSPRPDAERYDLSGPAKLRLLFRVHDRQQEIVLPVLLKPQFVNNTQWITLIGSRNFHLPE